MQHYFQAERAHLVTKRTASLAKRPANEALKTLDRVARACLSRLRHSPASALPTAIAWFIPRAHKKKGPFGGVGAFLGRRARLGLTHIYLYNFLKKYGFGGLCNITT